MRSATSGTFGNISLLIGIIAGCDVSAQRLAFKLGGDNAFNIANRRFFKWYPSNRVYSFWPDGKCHGGLVGEANCFSNGLRRRVALGNNRSNFSLQRHLATSYQYGHDHRYVSHGVSYSEHTNRDTLALQIKLSELILALQGADDKVADIEDATDEELEQAHEKVKRKSGKKTVRHM